MQARTLATEVLAMSQEEFSSTVARPRWTCSHANGRANADRTNYATGSLELDRKRV
jgi:hypothetical protein